MIKVYCDRCGKKLNTDDPNYYPLGAAANGDDIFFAVSVYNKSTKRRYNPRNKEVGVIDDSPDFVYDYNTPDLCMLCLREINQAVKTVWDGKSKDDSVTKPTSEVPKKSCNTCKYVKYKMLEEPCKSCTTPYKDSNHTNWEPKEE